MNGITVGIGQDITTSADVAGGKKDTCPVDIDKGQRGRGQLSDVRPTLVKVGIKMSYLRQFGQQQSNVCLTDTTSGGPLLIEGVLRPWVHLHTEPIIVKAWPTSLR